MQIKLTSQNCQRWCLSICTSIMGLVPAESEILLSYSNFKAFRFKAKNCVVPYHLDLVTGTKQICKLRKLKLVPSRLRYHTWEKLNRFCC
jgi:hypothetical protein